MRVIPLIGRILFAAIFIAAAPNHFSESTISYANSQGVPLASLTVPISGVLTIVGGLSILLGYYARVGAWLIALFLISVTPIMHNFWTITDPQGRMIQQIMFMKNLSMLGGALLIAYFGAGPLSFDSKK